MLKVTGNTAPPSPIVTQSKFRHLAVHLYLPLQIQVPLSISSTNLCITLCRFSQLPLSPDLYFSPCSTFATEKCCIKTHTLAVATLHSSQAVHPISCMCHTFLKMASCSFPKQCHIPFASWPPVSSARWYPILTIL